MSDDINGNAEKKAIKIGWSIVAVFALSTLSSRWLANEVRERDLLSQCGQLAHKNRVDILDEIKAKNDAGEDNPEILVSKDMRTAAGKWYSQDVLYKCSVTVPESQHKHKAFKVHIGPVNG